VTVDSLVTILIFSINFEFSDTRYDFKDWGNICLF